MIRTRLVDPFTLTGREWMATCLGQVHVRKVEGVRQAGPGQAEDTHETKSRDNFTGYGGWSRASKSM